VSVRVDTLGRQYVSRRRDKKCLQCGGAVLRRGTRVKYCSPECYDKTKKGRRSPHRRRRPINLVELACRNCGAVVHRKPSAIQDLTFCSRSCSNFFNLDRFSARSAANPTSLEILLYDYLRKSSITFVSQRRIGKFVVDAYLPRARTAIEVDGEYWHSRPENQARDRRKDAAMAGYAIRLVRISERQAKADIGAALTEAGICP
jgi:very-short-patch-repair endonuclease